MNWERIECERCGYTDYDDSMSNIEEIGGGAALCASCRVNEYLDFNEQTGCYE